MTNPKPSPGRLLSSTSTFFPPPLPSLATAPRAPPPLFGGGPPALSSTPSRSRGSNVNVTGTESRKLVLWMRAEGGGPLGVWAEGAPGKQRVVRQMEGRMRQTGSCTQHQAGLQLPWWVPGASGWPSWGFSRVKPAWLSRGTPPTKAPLEGEGKSAEVGVWEEVGVVPL